MLNKDLFDYLNVVILMHCSVSLSYNLIVLLEGNLVFGLGYEHLYCVTL